MGVHLWYLLLLFIFSLLTLSLFRHMRRESGTRFMARFVPALEKQGVIFLLALPLTLTEMIVNLSPDTIGRRE